jgi:stage III sporulation protein AA
MILCFGRISFFADGFGHMMEMQNREEEDMSGWAFEELLPEAVRRGIGSLPQDLTELRLRAKQPAEVVCGCRSEFRGEALSAALLSHTAHSLSEHSLYAREDELSEGYFTAAGGCRVGVCGRMSLEENGRLHMTHISSLCIRAAREVIGAADGIMDVLYENGRVCSALILSPPGMGKTTMLRDVLRQLSERGIRTAAADERGELAVCLLGVPTMDVGRRTDVMDGCPKRIAMRMLVRSMAPQVIVTDELGHAGDMEAVLDALRCGVQVIASVHADDERSAYLRCGAEIGCFERLIILGGMPGQVKKVIRRE